MDIKEAKRVVLASTIIRLEKRPIENAKKIKELTDKFDRMFD